MSSQLIAIAVFVVAFAVASLRGVHLGHWCWWAFSSCLGFCRSDPEARLY